MKTLEQVGQSVIEHNKHRRHFERSPEGYAAQIAQEAQELVHEINEAMVTDSAFAVAGEIGDLYILLAQLCESLGIQPAEAMEMKHLRNSWKYPDVVMNNGFQREEAFDMSKRFYREIIGGDAMWSHAYLDYLAEE